MIGKLTLFLLFAVAPLSVPQQPTAPDKADLSNLSTAQLKVCQEKQSSCGAQDSLAIIDELARRLGE